MLCYFLSSVHHQNPSKSETNFLSCIFHSQSEPQNQISINVEHPKEVNRRNLVWKRLRAFKLFNVNFYYHWAQIKITFWKIASHCVFRVNTIIINNRILRDGCIIIKSVIDKIMKDIDIEFNYVLSCFCSIYLLHTPCLLNGFLFSLLMT